MGQSANTRRIYRYGAHAAPNRPSGTSLDLNEFLGFLTRRYSRGQIRKVLIDPGGLVAIHIRAGDGLPLFSPPPPHSTVNIEVVALF